MTQLTGLSDSDFNVWKHHPVSKVYLQYLSDYRDMLVRELLARWEGGSLLSQDELEIRGRVMTLRELTELEFASIKTFYQTSEEDNAAQDSSETA